MKCLFGHKWVEVARKFSRHDSRGLEIQRCSSELMQKLWFGQTIIELKCSKCGDIKIKSFIGEV